MIALGRQGIVTGTLLPDLVASFQAFKQQHYNPQAIIATAGPDQGSQFTNAIGGVKNAEGVYVPNGGGGSPIKTLPKAPNGKGLLSANWWSARHSNYRIAGDFRTRAEVY